MDILAALGLGEEPTVRPWRRRRRLVSASSLRWVRHGQCGVDCLKGRHCGAEAVNRSAALRHCFVVCYYTAQVDEVEAAYLLQPTDSDNLAQLSTRYLEINVGAGRREGYLKRAQSE